MKILYFDCFAGISGNMTLAALIDLGVDPNQLIAELQKLNLEEKWELNVSNVVKNGITAKYVDVITEQHTHDEDTHTTATHTDSDNNTDRSLAGASDINFSADQVRHDGEWHKHTDMPQQAAHDHTHGHATLTQEGEHHHQHQHRSMEDIQGIIEKSTITEEAKKMALRIFNRLAKAEAKVHNTTPDKVQFHEVGATDSIIDIVGTAVCLDILKPDKIYASVQHDGYGFIECQHGTIPVPVPAVMEIFANANVPLQQINIPTELTTPTGAAIIAELVLNFGNMPTMKLNKIGYGAGTKKLGVPNVLRICMGERKKEEEEEEEGKKDEDIVTVIETNVDNSTPEILAHNMELLLQNGALDVFFYNIIMKKSRPATQINIICKQHDMNKLIDILLQNTNTIGVRYHNCRRHTLNRQHVYVNTTLGNVKAKLITINNNTHKIHTEFESAKNIAKQNNVTIQDVYQQVIIATQNKDNIRTLGDPETRTG
jgi:uncharacterized protein (TIGR00299 family) protein